MQSNGPSALRAWLAVAVWMTVTVILSPFPVEDLQPNVPDADKIGHAAVYAVLGFLCAVAWHRHGSSQPAAAERSRRERGYLRIQSLLHRGSQVIGNDGGIRVPVTGG